MRERDRKRVRQRDRERLREHRRQITRKKGLHEVKGKKNKTTGVLTK